MSPALALVLAVACAPPQSSVVVAAAADLQFAMPALVDAFSAAHPGVHVDVVHGSSGAFFAQVARGAPFDVFLSADVAYVDRLVAGGHARDHFVYGTGRLVLYSRAGAPVSAAGGPAVVADPQVARVALANPRHAPYGRAAEAALRSMGLYDVARPKFVLGENVAQAVHFVDSGAADVGFVALAFVRSPALAGKGVWVEVPATAHPPLVQGGCVVATTKEPAAALLQAAGFELPGASSSTSSSSLSSSPSSPGGVAPAALAP